MPDSQIILDKIADMRLMLAEHIGEVRADIAVLDTKIEGMIGPEGRVTKLENRAERQEWWTKAHTLALVALPPAVHKLLLHWGLFN
jgi:hypothetical protein